MVGNIDDALARLASEAPSRGLDGLEDRVLSAISNQPAAVGAGATLTAIVVALAIGMLSNAVPEAGAEASVLSPLGAPSPLAPSTLLVGSR